MTVPTARGPLQDWNRNVARIVACADTPQLPAVLVSAVRDLVAFEHSVVFGYPPGRRPLFLFDGFSTAQKKSVIAPYLQKNYLADPFFAACARMVEPGLYRMEDLAPADAESETHPGYVSPCVSDSPGYLSEEIGFFARTGRGVYIVLSLMRPGDAPPFSDQEFATLQEIEPVVQSALARQWQALGTTGSPPQPALGLSDYVEHSFQTFGRQILTEREQEVAHLILRGHSSASLAAQLGISPATAKIHRKNIYAKLNISSQSELFALFIDVLSTAPAAAGPRGPA
ncbi:MAG: helix-turn-helix transcriptional regulator [Rhodospirillaceae bacterium]|nr:helix-turn-helix transcriptional regulator [Rhodospirillaceae bacterium]